MSQDQLTESRSLLASPLFQDAKKALLSSISQATKNMRGIRPASGDATLRDRYLKSIQEFNRARGRDLYFPFLSSGLGSGPFIELEDGSVKLDLIAGIGINFFGHAHPEFMSEMVNALCADVMQGNLQPGIEATQTLKLLLSHVGSESRLAHGWFTSCGTMANEVALKIIRQKKAPATKILAFKDCFAGRSTAMQEITDNPKYREGQPTYGEVEYLPFFDPKLGLEKSVDATLTAMRGHLSGQPGKFAALMMELVQGEGGFQFAPREFYIRIFEEAKKANLAIWLDEVQTFGRTGQLFAYQTFKLDSWIDVATVGKMLQACAVLFSAEYNPKPGLVAGTFSGSTNSLRTARKTIEMLTTQGFLGPEGKIEKLSARFKMQLEKLSQTTCKGSVSDIRVLGGMIGFVPFSGSMEDVKCVLMRLFDLGAVAFYCGHGPNLIRLLPPLGAMEMNDVDLACQLIEKAMTS